jgi:hypothetical protein
MHFLINLINIRTRVQTLPCHLHSKDPQLAYLQIFTITKHRKKTFLTFVF